MGKGEKVSASAGPAGRPARSVAFSCAAGPRGRPCWRLRGMFWGITGGHSAEEASHAPFLNLDGAATAAATAAAAAALLPANCCLLHASPNTPRPFCHAVGARYSARGQGKQPDQGDQGQQGAGKLLGVVVGQAGRGILGHHTADER